MCPRHLRMKSRVPWTVWTSGRLNIAVSRGCIEALRPWHNPDLFSRGGFPGLGNVACCGHNRRINSRWGVVCEGMPTSGLWSEPQCRWHINRLELEAVFLALKDFRPQLEQRHVTELIVAPPSPIPIRKDLLSQVSGSVWHLNPELWSLHMWLLQGYKRS